jgi:hypothetical protein
MSNNRILPNEFHLLNDNPFIRTNCPRELVTDDMVRMQVDRGNLVAGDRVMVQCFSHDYSELLAEAEYRVTARRTSMQTVEVDHTVTRQYERRVFEVSRVTEWRVFGGGQTVKGKAVWNVGRDGWVIEVDGQEVGFEKDKATAYAIAAGKLPLPAEAA